MFTAWNDTADRKYVYPGLCGRILAGRSRFVSPNVIVMEASTGTVLYDCDSLEAHYPASITKIMTTLIALENSDLNDIVTFSDAAIDNTEGSGIARDYGEQMTMEQCLYAVMLASANECAYAVAEHVGGTIENFVAMMNEKAKDLAVRIHILPIHMVCMMKTIIPAAMIWP